MQGALGKSFQPKTRWISHYRFIDWATQGYIALVGLIVLLFHGQRLPLWPWLLLAHGAGLLAVHVTVQTAARRPGNRLLNFIRDFYPILLYGVFYGETGQLNQLFHQGYLDRHFFLFESRLFGFQPGLELMGRFPWRLLSEVLYAAYFSYYLMIGGVGLALLLRNRREFEHYVSVVSFTFYVCYLIFIFTPVVGPRIMDRGVVDAQSAASASDSPAPPIPASVAGAFFYQVMAWIYSHFETPGAAFPSSHVAVALCTLYFSFRYLRPIRWVHAVLAGLLCVATVYGHYHYVVDVVAGALVAAILVPLGNRLYARFGDPGCVGRSYNR